LRLQGASAAMHSQPPSFSEPGYTTILTGAWPDINDGPPINLDYGYIPVFTQDDIFSAAHRAGLRTAIFGYYWFEKLVPQAAVDSSFYTPGDGAEADQDVMEAALPELSGDHQLVLIHLDQVDFAGHHQGGPLSLNWDAAARNSDGYLREIVARLDLEQDTIIVLSDHGQIDRGGHGGPDPITLLEPFMMVGAGVRPGPYPDIQQVDVAPTTAALLGTNLPATAQGHVQSGMLTISSEQSARIRTAELTQKSTLYRTYTAAIKSYPGQQPDPSNLASYIAAMNEARGKKLAGERLWRIPLSILLAISPGVLLVVRKNKKTIWLAIGALIYVLLFNFRYAVLDGRTYSLSSIESATGFITYMVSTTVVAIVISWLVIMARLNAFRSRPRKAAETSLGLMFMTIYLLALPILVSFAWNGLVATWTLPEFYTIFVALLSFVQIMLIVVAGLLLSGSAALIARFMHHEF